MATLTPRRRAMRVTTLDELRARRAVAVGRGVLLGLDTLPDVVIADVIDHGSPGVTMPPGTIVVRVWGGDPDAAIELVSRLRPAGTVAITEWRPAHLRHRLVAAWRWYTHRIRALFARQPRK